MVLFIMLYKVLLTEKSGMKFLSVTIQIKLHKLLLTFESVDKILKCDHSKLLSNTFL